MASIDKIYGTLKQHNELGDWLSLNHPTAMQYFYSWEDEWLSDGKTHPIAIFPEEVDKMLFQECPFKWVKDRIKEQYDIESIYDVISFLCHGME